MRRRPSWFIFLALVFFVTALALPAQIMVIYGHSFYELQAVFAKLTFLNWLVFGGLLIYSVLVFRASPHMRLASPLMISLVALNNYFVGHYATDYSMFTASFGTLAFAAINLPLLHPDLQWLMLHPEKRWWMRAERKRLAIPITIEGTRLQPARAETFDVSESGAFVTAAQDVGVGDWITVRMSFGTFTKIRCQARVVRRSEASGTYPGGIGVQFMNLSWRDRRDIRRCLEREQ
jgi:hypothetical protein